MWMNWLGIISIRTSQPSSSIQAASWRAAWTSVRSSPLPITILPGLDDDHVAALERGGGDHPVDRDPGLLVEADHRRVLAAPPLLVELGDDRALGSRDARVAREHLVGQGRVGLEEVAADAGALVGGDHLGVLGGRGLGAEAAVALERRLRDRAGRQPAEVVGRAEEDVEQPPVLGVGAPGDVGGIHVVHSITTLIVERVRSLAPRT